MSSTPDAATAAGAPAEERRITSLSFLTPGNFEDEHPAAGLQDTLELFAYGEELGFQGAWVRQRHLEHGVGSAAVFLAAAAQRTSRIELGSGVIPLGYENPWRLAEDLSLADVLSGGRLQIGVSTGRPPHAELLAEHAFDRPLDEIDFSHRRVERLIEHLRSPYLGDQDTRIHSPGNVQRPRLQPHSPGLADRVWYGGSSNASIDWAASAGVNLAVANIGSADNGDEFFSGQLAGVHRFRAGLRSRQGQADGRTPRIIVGRVIVPTDSADADARERYEAYRAGRHERTLRPQTFGARTTVIAPDYVGTSEQILERLRNDPVVAEAHELQLNLPYEFAAADYRQILSDVRERIAPELGWQPAEPARR